MGTITGLIATYAAELAIDVFMIVHSGFTASRSGPLTKKWHNRWYVVVAIAVVLIFALPEVLRATWFKVARYQMWSFPEGTETTGMEPTMLKSDQFVVDRWAYSRKMPSRGDVVALPWPGKPRVLVIKRCVAIAGDRVAIIDKRLFVNDREVPEPYVVHTDPSIIRAGLDLMRDNYGSITLQLGMMFVLGDNRDETLDSRYWGPVPARSNSAKFRYVYWSEDWSRIGKDLSFR
ncbi:MAG: signal peptidase I [Spirochaetia bacterium]